MISVLVPTNSHCDIENFLRANSSEELALAFGRDRSEKDKSDERPGSPLSRSADNWCKTSPLFCGSLLGATGGLFVLIFNVFVIFQRPIDFMISVTYFALENIAISKVKIDQDQPEWRRSGAGKKCDVMFQCVFSVTFKMKNCCLQFH